MSEHDIKYSIRAGLDFGATDQQIAEHVGTLPETVNAMRIAEQIPPVQTPAVPLNVQREIEQALRDDSDLGKIRKLFDEVPVDAIVKIAKGAGIRINGKLSAEEREEVAALLDQGTDVHAIASRYDGVKPSVITKIQYEREQEQRAVLRDWEIAERDDKVITALRIKPVAKLVAAQFEDVSEDVVRSIARQMEIPLVRHISNETEGPKLTLAAQPETRQQIVDLLAAKPSSYTGSASSYYDHVADLCGVSIMSVANIAAEENLKVPPKVNPYTEPSETRTPIIQDLHHLAATHGIEMTVLRNIAHREVNLIKNPPEAVATPEASIPAAPSPRRTNSQALPLQRRQEVIDLLKQEEAGSYTGPTRLYEAIGAKTGLSVTTVYKIADAEGLKPVPMPKKPLFDMPPEKHAAIVAGLQDIMQTRQVGMQLLNNVAAREVKIAQRAEEAEKRAASRPDYEGPTAAGFTAGLM